MQDGVLILDFGSQYTQLIARRVRELHIYCEVHPYHHLPEELENFKAVILSGSPFSVRSKDVLHPDLSRIQGKIPLLGICYGAQYLAHFGGGSVAPSNTREYGRAHLSYVKDDEVFFKEIPTGSQVWMSHGDTITMLPENGILLSSTEDVIHAAYKIEGEETYAIQFHPEVSHTKDGKQLLKNFLTTIAGISPRWTPDRFIETTIDGLKKQLNNDKVVLGLSGGVDSTVAAVLLHKAIGKNLHCIFVNNGLLRKNEYEEVLSQYKEMGLNIKGVDASAHFLEALKRVTDPERKRKAIGRIFIEVFEEEARHIKEVTWLAQGTIYPDVIESVSVKGPSATIKSHHNVGGLPDTMKLKVVEPLRMLFKDEVRAVGKALHIDTELLERHPFPGPGLAIRVLGAVTKEKVSILQEVDAIFIQRLKEWKLYNNVWQAGAILLPIRSVGVMGDERTYEKCVALRAVESTDGMTADWAQLPYEFLQKTANEIINKVKGVNRVVYDISSKPPATVEWE
ncbi:MAG: glutamine-hydrolyzing GMP synthase [Bacteroidota bacterium]